MDATCERCGAIYGISCWPFCPHGRVQPRPAFEPYFDVGLGRYVTGWGDVRQGMREHHLDFRDHPTRGDLSARRDRIEEGKRRDAAR